MEEYLERALLSILNQTFKNYEILIINDCSNDDIDKIVNRINVQPNVIKIINHNKNLGIYASRVDGILNSNGKYILYLDPDDLYLNPFLFQKLYSYNFKYNLDIIEFSVLYEEEGKNKILFPKEHFLSHFHNYSEKIIYQPKLSNILFFKPRTNNYTYILCRSIWNKMIKKEILLKTINFIGKKTYENFKFNFAEDTIMNIINFEFASNYSNIDMPGYLYNIRKNSMTHENSRIKKNKIVCKNFLLYLKLLYKYIKFYDKDINYLFFEIKYNIEYIINFMNNNIMDFIIEVKDLLTDIINDNNTYNKLK
jgi:glycosyltransferase involved in cell wall biosynthesis